MYRIPALTVKEVVRVLKKFGFVEDRQRGSHLVLINQESGTRTVVPVHRGRTLKRSLFFTILKDAELTLDEFLEKCDIDLCPKNSLNKWKTCFHAISAK